MPIALYYTSSKTDQVRSVKDETLHALTTLAFGCFKKNIETINYVEAETLTVDTQKAAYIKTLFTCRKLNMKLF